MSSGIHRQGLPRGLPGLAILLRLLPLLLFFLLTLGGGFLHALAASVVAGPQTWRLLLRSDLLSSILLTIRVGAVSALLAVAVGAVGAYLLWRAPRWVFVLGSMYRLPIVLPHIAVAYLVMLFWARTGLVSSLLFHLGVMAQPEQFPAVLFGSSGTGLILAYFYKGFPFVMLLCLGVLQRISPGEVTTAGMLGAGPVRTFLRVILPRLFPILGQTGIILFLFSLGGFDIPWLLGGSRPQMLPVTVYSLFFQGTRADQAVALTALVVLALFAVVFAVVAFSLLRVLTPWEERE